MRIRSGRLLRLLDSRGSRAVSLRSGGLVSIIFVICAVLAVVFYGSGLAVSERPTTKWTVSGQQILLNGKPFFVKGVSYSPTPVGGSCNWSPFGDWFTPSWRKIYERDLPALRQLGANSIRVYCWLAFDSSDENYANFMKLDFSSPAAHDHADFLDKAWNGGLNPLYVLINVPIDRPRTFYVGSDAAKIGDSENVYGFYKRTARWAAEKYGKHPAVMGFTVGNECNDDEDATASPLFWERIEEIARLVKAAAQDKVVVSCWFPHPRDHFLNFPRLLQNENFDVIGVNLYDGDLTNAEFWKLFKITLIDKGRGKPFLATEFGTPACRHEPDGRVVEDLRSINDQAEWIVSKWKDIVAHSVIKDPKEGIASGGYVFAWSDEWWKTKDTDGQAAVQDPGFVKQAFLAGGWLDDEWFGLNAIKPHPDRPPLHPWEPDKYRDPYPPDILTPRKAYHAIREIWRSQ